MSRAAARPSFHLEGEQLGMLMQQLHIQTGITIESSSNVVAGCIQQRMDYLGVNEMENYLAAFDEGINARAEWLALVDLLTVKETRFFRQPEAYSFLGRHLESLLSCGSRPKELSFWSAGCANGQELYSIAMEVENVVSRHNPWQEWHGIGTDISFKAINHAQQGVYTDSAVASIPVAYCESYLEPKLGGRHKVNDNILSRTHFFHSTLLHVDAAPFADFDIIYCQNVLIYFSRDRQRWIIDQLVNRLSAGGLLILGAGEDVSWSNQSVRRMAWPGVCAYQKTRG
jgi:chemotaxis methyl-accepting protein methylase